VFVSKTAQRRLTDDEAWIVSHNLPLVDSCLRGRWQQDDATYQDLRAAGYLGMCRAIQLYDPRISMWSTYACRWIRSFIQLQIKLHHSLISVPNYQIFHYSRGSAPSGRAHFGQQAQAVLNGHRIQWDDAEAIAVLAVSPPRESEHDYQQVIEKCLERLPADHREIVRRVVMDEEHPRDVATDMGISTHKVMGIRRRGLRLLRMSMPRHLCPVPTAKEE
jgi:RNA polymerase sigma factor (sigma-70 family)